MQTKTLFFAICIVLFTISCKQEKLSKQFTFVPSSKSNITFENTITENDSLNVVTFQYVYNGGGVGIGDFNNDGFSDIIFTGNQVPSKIYLNQKEFEFKDITEESRLIIPSKEWVTGVAIVDINADGWDDIYLSVGGANCNNDCNNLLFVNQGTNNKGIPVFVEKAAAYNLNEGEYSQQAVFFDFDTDGDLDVFIARNGNLKYDKNSPLPKRYLPENLTDVLLVNEQKEGDNHPVYKDVSKDLGILYKGFALGVTIQDFNNDNLPDIYVSNDFITEDLLYLNQGVDIQTNTHLGFKESNQFIFKHLTYNAMGVDVADVNNDANPDVLVVDMLPEEYQRQKKMLGSMNYDKHLLSKRNYYASQFMHNTLQIHNGMLKDSLLKASEVGFMSGMSSTDWSWAPILADFDNDGDKDVFVTNGYVKDITDLDFINYSSQSTIFGDQKSKDQKLKKMLKELPGIYLPNYFYKNNGKIQFKDVSSEWMEEKASFSNGAAFADLDNDGDLDIVVNNSNENAFVLQNNAEQFEDTNFLRVKLKGTFKNKKAIGAKITLWQNGKSQHQYQSVIRGYLSSMEPIVHFGVDSIKADSLQVIWPNGKISKLKEINTNTTIELDILLAKEYTKHLTHNQTIFRDISKTIAYEHKENKGHDYTKQHLLVRQYSKFGPCVAAGDIDGKTGDEIILGGSKGEPLTIWFENSVGNFELKQTLGNESEDTDISLIDIDGDNDLDMYVASGGSEFPDNAKELQDRIYINNGEGEFKLAENKLPKELYTTSSCVRPNDFDKDGDIDFFVGTRIVTGRYPTAPKSYLLENKNGIFTDIIHKEIATLGMITDAVWEDINSDGWDDLILVGEWMPITILINNKGKLEKTTFNFIDNHNNSIETNGWWNTIASGDFDNDGDVDFLIGNQGTNGFIKPQKNKPVYVYANDFDGNGSIDPIIGQYHMNSPNNEALFPVQSRDDIMKQVVSLKKRYPTYGAFSKASYEEILQIENLEKVTLKATTFSSSYIENLGNGNFKLTELPQTCQIAPINDISIKDIDNDGYLDALLVGNDMTSETNYGYNDGLIGVYLKGGKNGFEVVKNNNSGFYVPGQSNHIIQFKNKKGEQIVLATQNNQRAKLFSINKKKK